RTEERMGLKPAHLAADTAYGTGRFLAWVVARGIAPHIPVWDHSHRNDGTFSRDQFKFDKERNIYVCPMGKLLKTTGRILSENKFGYMTSTRDCGLCPLKSKCCRSHRLNCGKLAEFLRQSWDPAEPPCASRGARSL